jgi:CDGSH-type Zn-finger protein
MSDTTIEVLKNGPLWVEGIPNLVTHDGKKIVIPEGRKGIALCRCGASENKPFCDGNHKAAEFGGDVQAEIEA